MTERFEDEGYECVEPELGRDLPLLDDPHLDPDLRRRLLAHLAVCDECRLRRDLLRRVALKIADGQLDRTGPATGVTAFRWYRLAAWGGATALAAGLGLLMMLPPQARDSGYRFRTAEQEIITRPVEGEIIAGGNPRFQWRPVAGAGKYRLEIREVGGAGTWQAETTGNELSLPVGRKLPEGADFRASLHTVPADLAPAGGVSVAFRTGSRGDMIRQRLGHGNTPARLAALAGAVSLLLGAGWGFWKRD